MRTHSPAIDDSAKSRWISSLPSVIWYLVGQQIHGSEDVRSLKSLIRVCRAFRDMFTPILYSRRVVYVDKYFESSLLETGDILPSTLLYTKELEVQISFISDDLDEPSFSYTGLIRFLEKALSMMPNLQSFRWFQKGTELDEHDHDKCTLLTERDFMHQLKKLPKLRHLWLQVPDHQELAMDQVDDFWFDIAGFHELTILDLYNFYGESEQLAHNIACCLIEHPQLRRLGLGFSVTLDGEINGEVPVVNDEDDFLENLCFFYKNHYRGTPLALHTLRLGYGVSPIKSKMGQNANYLNDLVRTADLRTVEIFNGLVLTAPCAGDLGKFHPQTPDFLLLKDCKSITHLCITRLEEDVAVWLNDDRRSSIQELTVHKHVGPSCITDSLTSSLNLPSLSVLVATEIHGKVPRELSDDPLDVRSRGSMEADSDDDGDALDEGFSREVDDDYERIYPNRPQHLSPYTLLDKLEDRGARLKSLRISIDLRTQWEHLSTRLHYLGSLTHLYIYSCYHGHQNFPQEITSLWEGVNSSYEIAYRYGERICMECPPLRYLRIGPYAWKVWYDDGERRMRAMNLKEIQGIPFFDIDHYDNVSGLKVQPLARSSAYLRRIIKDERSQIVPWSRLNHRRL